MSLSRRAFVQGLPLAGVTIALPAIHAQAAGPSFAALVASYKASEQAWLEAADQLDEIEADFNQQERHTTAITPGIGAVEVRLVERSQLPMIYANKTERLMREGRDPFALLMQAFANYDAVVAASDLRAEASGLTAARETVTALLNALNDALVTICAYLPQDEAEAQAWQDYLFPDDEGRGLFDWINGDENLTRRVLRALAMRVAK